MCETLLRGVYKRIFFNPGLYQTTNLPKGEKSYAVPCEQMRIITPTVTDIYAAIKLLISFVLTILVE